MFVFLKGSLGKNNVGFSDESIFFRWMNIISDFENFVRITENIFEIFPIKCNISRNSEIGMFVNMNEHRAVFDDFIFSCLIPKIKSVIMIIENNGRNSLPNSSYKVFESSTLHEFPFFINITKNYFRSDLYIEKSSIDNRWYKKCFFLANIVRKRIISRILI